MKKIIFLFLFFLAAQNLFSQNSETDSLLKVLQTQKEDTNKIRLLNELSYKLILTDDYDKAMKYSNDAIMISEKLIQQASDVPLLISIKKAKANTYHNMGIVQRNKADYNSALDFYSKALAIRIEINDEKGIAASYNNMGNVYGNKGNYDKALEFYLKATAIREKLGDKKGIADSYLNLGIFYRDNVSFSVQSGRYDKALEYFLKALKFYEEIGDKQRIGMTCNNTGILYHEKRDYDKSLKYYFKALSVNEEIGSKKGMASSYNSIGNVMDDKQDYNKAMEYYYYAVKIHEEIGNKHGMAGLYNNIGILNLKLGKAPEAKKLSIKSFEIAKKIDAKELIKDAAITLSQCDSASGNFKGAYEYHKLYSDVKDTILNEESGKQIAEMQTKYETEKKEQQITLLNKDKELQDAQVNRQKIIIWSVAAGFLLVLILSIFIFRERKKSEKLLLNILPAETARELKANGKATAKHYEQVTVMFTDFKGFTTIAEKLSAEELVSELDFLFRKFDEIISKYPIEKIKTIGDAYMCAGGLPAANNTNPNDVVSAALEIQEWMKERQEAVAAAVNTKQLPTAAATAAWSLRIGIHTGAVTAGVVGDKKFAYDIWGDTVNTASRMESSGEPGKINISEATYLCINSDFECEYRGKVAAKNKGEIGMYFVKKRM